MAGGVTLFTAMAIGARKIASGHGMFEIMLRRFMTRLMLVVGGAGDARRTGLVRHDMHFANWDFWFYAPATIQ